MRICYLANANSIHTFRFLRYFAEKGHDIHLFSLKPALDEFRRLPIQIHDHPACPFHPLTHAVVSLLRIPHIRHSVRRLEPDILHCHEVFAHGLVGYVTGLPYILSPWGSDILILPHISRILNLVIRAVIRNAAYILREEGDFIGRRLTELGADPARMATFLCGVDTERFTPAKRDMSFRRQFAADYEVLVISTRQLAPVYNLETYISAAARLTDSPVPMRFLIVGQGPERGSLERLAGALNMSGRIRFLGRLPEDELVACLASSDIYVSTSLSDSGIASSTAEAMSCGLAVVSTDFGDNSDWIQDGINGCLFRAKDADQLARKLLYLASAPVVRSAFGLRNVAIAKERCDYWKQMAKVENFYNSYVLRSHELDTRVVCKTPAASSLIAWQGRQPRDSRSCSTSRHR